MPAGALVVIETSAGEVRQASLEAITAARALEVGAVSAVVIGHDIAAVADDIASRGVALTLGVDRAELARYTAERYTAAVEAAIERVDPLAVLFGGTTAGRDLGPYIAARAAEECLSDCVRLRWDDGALVGTRPVHRGKMLADVRVQPSRRAFAVVRAGSYQVPAAATPASLEPLAVTWPEQAPRVHLLDVAEKPTGAGSLASAEVIVVGGRGVGSPEGFELVEELARALGGVVGATRAVTDAGWRPRNEQVGQTGTTVRPKLYVGLGVSGAVQHMAGMRGAETIVAINSDPDAPMVRGAAISVIGELHEIVPMVIEELRRNE